MSKVKNNYYAVIAGRVPGIYKSWPECQEQIDKFSGAVYRGFPTLWEAEHYMSIGVSEEAVSDEHLESIIEKVDSDTLIAYVDGSYSEEKKKYSYGCVLIHDGTVIETECGSGNHPGSISMRNVAGELMGAIRAIKMTNLLGFKSLLIHYDYAGIEQWANGGWRTKSEGAKFYAEMVKGYRRAGMKIEFQKVQAHNGVTFNEMADRLAREGMDK